MASYEQVIKFEGEKPEGVIRLVEANGFCRVPCAGGGLRRNAEAQSSRRGRGGEYWIACRAVPLEHASPCAKRRFPPQAPSASAPSRDLQTFAFAEGTGPTASNRPATRSALDAIARLRRNAEAQSSREGRGGECRIACGAVPLEHASPCAKRRFPPQVPSASAPSRDLQTFAFAEGTGPTASNRPATRTALDAIARLRRNAKTPRIREDHGGVGHRPWRTRHTSHDTFLEG